MTQQISFELHPDDETILRAKHAGMTRTFIIAPDAGCQLFVVTMPSGETRTVSYEARLWGYMWHSSGGGSVKEYHACDGKAPEASGDVKAILAVLAWMKCREERRQAGQCTPYSVLAQRVQSETARIRRMEPAAIGAAATFCTKYHGRRTGR